MSWNFIRKLLGLPSQADEYVLIGLNFFAEGKFHYARTTFNLALTYDPDHKRAKKYVAIMEKFIELEEMEHGKVL